MCKFEILHIRSFNLNIQYMATNKQTYTRTLQCSPTSVGRSLRLALISRVVLVIFATRVKKRKA